MVVKQIPHKLSYTEINGKSVESRIRYTRYTGIANALADRSLYN